jgi:F-type H+-transporting ATPase subunit b
VEQLGINLNLFIVQLINFLVVVGLLTYFLYRPILNMLSERTRRIEESLRDAEQVKQQLANTNRDYEAKLAEARQEAAQIITQARERAQQQEREIIEQANREAGRVRDDARAQAEQERAQMLSTAKTQIAELVALTASQVLKAEVSAQGHQKLIDESLAALDRRN